MDKKAKEILFKTYWTAFGWRPVHTTDPADFEYAKSKGLMFDRMTISKSDLLSRLHETVKEANLTTITDAFLCSLTNKRLDWRSALASYANAKRILDNPDIDDYHMGHGKDIDVNVLNFERIKFGGVRHHNALYNLLDLQLLQKELIPKPTEADIRTFKEILSFTSQSAHGNTASKLRDSLSAVYKSSKNERHTLIEILACAQILSPLTSDRKEPSKHDWTFALNWRGEDKYNSMRAKYYFGNYGIQ